MRTTSLPFMLATLLLTAGISLTTTGCGAAASAGDRAVIDQAQSLHRALQPAVMEEEARVKNYLQQIGQRIVIAAKDYYAQMPNKPADSSEWMFTKNIQFHLVAGRTLNATTAGGEHVYIYNALFQRCETEDELAAVVAHEYAHVFARHVRRNFTALPPDAPPQDIMRLLVNNRFNAQEEQEADQYAFAFFARAGWDPARYEGLYQKLPGNDARVTAAHTRADALPPAARDWQQAPIADDRRFAQHKRDADSLSNRKLQDATAALFLTAMPSCVSPVDTPEQRAAQDQVTRPPAVESPGSFQKGPRERG